LYDKKSEKAIPVKQKAARAVSTGRLILTLLICRRGTDYQAMRPVKRFLTA